MPGTDDNVLFFAEAWGVGGIESFILNAAGCLARRGCRSTVFAVYEYDDSLVSRLADGGVRLVTAFRDEKPGLAKRLAAGVKAFRHELQTHSYDVVHANIMNGTGFAYLHEARRAGISVRVAHSHNSRFSAGMRGMKSLAHGAGRALWGADCTKRLACSEEAGRYLFGSAPFTVVPNSIDTERFAYDEARRESLRRRLSVEPGQLLVGNVSRINAQKNPLFQLEVFSALLSEVPDAKYCMVGTGDMEQRVREEIERRDLSSHVMLLPATTSPEDFYAAFDVLLFPSLFEGLSMTLVEAQCGGLPCVVSDGISAETEVTDLLERVPLEEGAQRWATQVADVWRASARSRAERTRYAEEIAKAGFGLQSLSACLERAYGCA